MIWAFSERSKAVGLALAIISLFIGGAKSTADPKAASEEESAWSPPTYVVERTRGVITVDGWLNEPDWIRAESVGDFVFPWWDESKGEKDQTVAKILWDDLNLYVGFLCHDPYIWAEITERDDPVYLDDCVEVFLSPDPEDVERTYSIEINAIGAILDSFRQQNPDGSITSDRSWNTEGMKVAYSHRGTLNDDSDRDTLWIMEVAIPLSNFRSVAKNIPPKDDDVWRLNLNRCGGKTKAQYSQWSNTGTPEPNFHVPSRFGQVYFSLSTKEVQEYIDRTVSINWGLKSVQNQDWDGRVMVSEGQVIAFPTPLYSQGQFGIYNQRVSKTSWKMRTNYKKGGLLLKLHCPEDATVTVENETFPFSFKLSDLKREAKAIEDTMGAAFQFAAQTGPQVEPMVLMDGNIAIRDITGTYVYVRTGAETGTYGEGQATITPKTAVCNSLGTWMLRHTVGERGIPVGGGIRVSLHHSRSWGIPQFEDPTAENYVTVRTTGKSTLDYTSPALGCFDWPDMKQIVLVRVREQPLVQGDEIIVTLGDRSGGSPGFRAAQTNESYTVFRVESCTEINEDYFPIYRRIRECPSVGILVAEPAQLCLVVPSSVIANELFEVTLRVEDGARNVVQNYQGAVDLYLEAERIRKGVQVTEADQGIVQIGGIVAREPGVYQFTVRDEERNLLGYSNPFRCEEKPAYHLYWGELHSHSFYSDGYGTKEEAYGFLRDVARLDFAAITDHEVEADTEDYTILAMWVATQKASAEFNEPHRFVTFPAFEWSPQRYAINADRMYGDHNVYFMTEDPGRPLLAASYPSYNTTIKLYEGLHLLNDKAMVIPHVGGWVASFDFHDAGLEPLAEIYSVHGSFEGFGQLALGKYGYHIGFIAAGDSHNGQAGGFPPSGVAGHYNHGGLTGIYAKELTREALWEAFYTRRTYATTGERILLDFRINGRLMGSEITINEPPILSVVARGIEPIWKVDVIKDGKVIHSYVNDKIQERNRLTMLWRNWLRPEDFDEAAGSGELRKVTWDGNIKASGGRMVSFNPCSFDLMKDRILTSQSDEVSWESQTSGDWDGISLELKDVDKAAIDFNTDPKALSFEPGRMKRNIERIQINEADELVIIRGKPLNQTIEFTYEDKDFSGRSSYYYIRVTQIDGEEAWSSPIFVSSKGE